jgi:hypothetical protein
MSSFSTQRSIARNIVLSANIQETIGEVMADAAFTYRSRAETAAFAKLTYEMESDLQYTGKNGKSTATESRLIAMQSALDYSARLDDFLAGYAFAMVMDQETFTAGVGAAPNTHLFTFKDTGDPSVLTNAYIEDSAGLKRKWSDLAATQVVLSGTDKGSVMVKISFVGLGTVTADVANAMLALPALPTAQYLYGSDSTVSMGPIGALVSKSPRVLSWEATFDHGKSLFRAVGGGKKPYFVRLGEVINKLKLVIANDGSSDLEDWRENQTPLGISIAVASGAASCTMAYANVVLPNADLSDQNKMVATTLELDENCILQPAGGGDAVTVTTLNTDVAYLTPA